MASPAEPTYDEGVGDEPRFHDDVSRRTLLPAYRARRRCSAIPHGRARMRSALVPRGCIRGCARRRRRGGGRPALARRHRVRARYRVQDLLAYARRIRPSAGLRLDRIRKPQRRSRCCWPAPSRFEDQGGVAYGYKDGVLLPIRVVPNDPAKSVALRLKLDYGVCKDICIPASRRRSAEASGRRRRLQAGDRGGACAGAEAAAARRGGRSLDPRRRAGERGREACDRGRRPRAGRRDAVRRSAGGLVSRGRGADRAPARRSRRAPSVHR